MKSLSQDYSDSYTRNLMPKGNIVGPLGEELVAQFLMKRGYQIIDRNFRRPWGELDVIAKKKEKIHFVEVKSFSSENVSGAATKKFPSGPQDVFRPEDNVSRRKMARLSRIIQTYLASVSNETSWQFDVATVLIDTKNKKARINFLEDIILER